MLAQYLQSPLLACVTVAAAAAFAPSSFVALVVRNVAIAYALVFVLDLVVARYHLAAVPAIAPHATKYALVTGGSSGIGREIAFQLAAEQYSLILAARNSDALEKTQTEIQALYPKCANVRICACDLSTHEGIQRLVAYVDSNQLEVEILINNAGASFTCDFVDLTPQRVDELLTLNVVAMAKLSHAIVPQMVARGRGRVLNIASMSSAISIPTAALYGSSKAFMLNLSQAMNYELRATGVTVTGMCPGPVHTNFSATAHCDSSIYMNLPGAVLDAKECARRSLLAMFDADNDCYDTIVSRWGAAVFRTLLPSRLGLLVAAVCMNEPRKMLKLIRT
uniref:Ketoacyl reductase n=1 Tax=Globisporangium ultimum (strain ATCC 200006 / CBS 805.95 / DAOM BR144) TaxID=431595 RepID=K3WI49_GLOUD